MANITVGQLAKQIKKDEDTLLKQLKTFGIEKSSKDDTLTDAEMKTMLEKINSSKATAARKKVTKTVNTGGSHKINVSVKKKRRVAKAPVEAQEEKVEAPKTEAPAVAAKSIDMPKAKVDSKKSRSS